MTKNEYKDRLSNFFDMLDYYHGYYWHWEKMLRVFDFINELSHGNNLISDSAYESTKEYIKTELKRYEY